MGLAQEPRNDSIVFLQWKWDGWDGDTSALGVQGTSTPGILVRIPRIYGVPRRYGTKPLDILDTMDLSSGRRLATRCLFIRTRRTRLVKALIRLGPPLADPGQAQAQAQRVVILEPR